MAYSSSSSSPVRKYDVFLSFRGIDTRKSFVGFLYKGLERMCIKTFKDDKELEKGSSISPELIQAIEESRFAVVVVSENYASSSWCLEELAKIMECEEKNSLTAIPIFYEVDPSHARWQKGKFAEHFEKHEKRENPDKVQRWRGALTKLANKSGMDSRNWGDNAEIIDEIAKDILNRLISAASSDFTGLVGMDVHLGAMHELLDLESNEEARMIAIWGMGGVGKTTIARYIYENISRHFQTCCFLEDVKKIYHDLGESGLQRELLSRIQGEALRNSYLGSNVINERFRHRKVLLVFDDVDDVEQLDALAKQDTWFGPGSRVIMTTRDKHLLDLRGIKYVYEAKCLAFNEALQLFCQFAFKKKCPPNGFQRLSEHAAGIAGGLPLALRVFGSFLCGRDKEFWEDAFPELETSLDKKVMKILKISYDELHEGHKYIFLYVACFFNGQGLVSDVVDIFDKGAKSGIEVLAEKCLISISEDGNINMHDLIKQMGRELVCQQSEPTKRMILWKPHDIYEVLSNERESRAVEAVSFNLDEADELTIKERAFQNMPNLKLLKLYHSIRSSPYDGETKLQLPEGIRFNFSKLRYLRWDIYPSKILQIRAKNLVKLYLRDSKIEKLWEYPLCLENLKEIDISRSKNLKEFPDLSKAPNLEVVRAEECTSLTEIPPSIRSLDKLTMLDLGQCYGLQRVPNNLDMKSLEDVYLWYCSSLKMYPEFCRGVKYLIHGITSESELPESIGRLSYLMMLEMYECKRLKHLPDTIGDLISLKHLMLGICPMLQSIPESIGRLSYLEHLELYKCERLKHLPDTIGDLISLKSLNLGDCPMLRSIPKTIWKLESLETFEVLDGRDITEFPNLPETVRRVKFKGTMITEIPSSIGNLHLLEELDISESRRLKNVPGSIYRLKCLKRLVLWDCPFLKSLPSQICVSGSYFDKHDAEETSSLLLPNLEVLTISRPGKSGDLSFRCPLFSNFPSLRILRLVNLSMPEICGDLGLLTDLKELDLSGNDFGMMPTSIKRLTMLSELYIRNCVNLYSLPELSPNIKILEADGCAALATLAEIIKLNFTNKRFKFTNCFKLKEEIQLFSKYMVSMVGDGAVVVLPGSEVPSCFDHRNRGSSLTISLPCTSSLIELKGFVVYFVIESHGKDLAYVDWEFRCMRENCCAKVVSGEFDLFRVVEVDHAYIFNRELKWKEDENVVFDQILFEFFPKWASTLISELPPTIKDCGVCLQFDPSSSSATCDGSSTSGSQDPLEAEKNTTDSQDEVKEPSTKKQKLF